MPINIFGTLIPTFLVLRILLLLKNSIKKIKDTYYKTMRFHNHDENRGMLPANVRPVLFKATVQEPCKMESEVVTN